MSSQQGILNVFSSNKLWTAPSKDQYLPSYFKGVCDVYAKSENAHRVFPVECLGRQKTSDPSTPIWVIGSNLHVKVDIKTGRAERLGITDSPYCVLDSKVSYKLPTFNFEGNLDTEILEKLITVMNKHMGSNFPSTLLTMGGVGLAVHYEQLCTLYDGVPLILAWGKPVSGKTTAAKTAMALIGQHETVGECTLAGALELASSRTVPFLWDDASDFTIIEKLAVAVFNQSQKKTSGKRAHQSPRTVPVLTMNPQVLKKTIKNDKEKIARVFSRIAVIPFNRVSPKQDLGKSMRFQTEIKPLIESAIQSIGTILELSAAFATMQSDSIFEEVLALSNDLSDLDMRAQFNYSMLLFSTGKILEKLGMKDEYFPLVKDWMVQGVIPNHKAIMALGNKPLANTDEPSQVRDEKDSEDLVKNLINKAAENPLKVQSFFKPKFVARKCACGEVFGFKVVPMLQFMNLKDAQASGEVLRSYVRRTGIGCNGIKLRFKDGIQHHGTHIRRKILPTDLLAKLDSAFMQKPDVPAMAGNNEAGPSGTANDNNSSVATMARVDEAGPSDTAEDILIGMTKCRVEEAVPSDTAGDILSMTTMTTVDEPEPSDTDEDILSEIATMPRVEPGPSDNAQDISSEIATMARMEPGPSDNTEDISSVTTTMATVDEAGPSDTADDTTSVQPIVKRKKVKRTRDNLVDNLSVNFQPTGKRNRRQRHK